MHNIINGVLVIAIQVDIVGKGEVTQYVGLLCVPHNRMFPSKRKLLIVALSCWIPYSLRLGCSLRMSRIALGYTYFSLVLWNWIGLDTFHKS